MSHIYWTPEKIKEKIFLSEEWTERALVALYNLQTEEEKAGDHPNTINGVGFNRYDSAMLSTFAEWIIEGDKLSVSQLRQARSRLRKYAGQLANIANKNEEIKHLDRIEGRI